MHIYQEFIKIRFHFNRFIMQKSNNSSSGFLFLMLFCVLAFIIYFYWKFNHTSVVFHISKLCWRVLDFIDVGLFSNIVKDLKREAVELATYSQYVSFYVFYDFLNKFGYLFILFPIIFTLYLSYKIGKTPIAKINRLVNINTLPAIIAKHCPAIIPSLYYGDKSTLLLNTDPAEHKSALDPIEWSKDNNLIINRLTFNRKKCRELLVEQLGTKISNITELSDCEKTMFTIFASRIFTKEPEIAVELTDKLNFSCHKHTYNGKKGYPDLRITDSLFNEYSTKFKDKIDNLIKIYSYSRTILYAMHLESVKKGKLPSSYFRWLKGMDRGLFYVLNTTGRKTPFIESTGVFSDYLWRSFNNKNNIDYSEPMFEEAIDGIENYLIKAGELELNRMK